MCEKRLILNVFISTISPSEVVAVSKVMDYIASELGRYQDN